MALEIAPPGTVEASELPAAGRRLAVSTDDGAARAAWRAGAGGRAAACAGGRRDGAGGVVRCRAATAGRLLLVIHHLAVDGVSWRILVPDLAAAWAAIARGEAAGAGAARAPRSGAGRSGLRRRRRMPGGRRASVLDRDAERAVTVSLVDGALDPARDVIGTRRASDADAAGRGDGGAADAGAGGVPWRHQRCAADRPGAGGCGLVPAAWPRRRQPAVLLDLEGHGREEVFADVDLSRTVGWFTSLFPVRLDPGALDLDEALAGGPALGRALKLIKEQLRALPGQRARLWAAALSQPRDGRRSLAGFAPPQIGFNYLGRFAAAGGGGLGCGC